MLAQTSRLDGKVALVTGSGRGIGRAIVERLAAEGARVVASQRTAEEGEELARRLTAAGREVAFVPADVRDETACARLVDATVERFGRLDVLCNNAGVGLLRPVTETTRSDYDLVLDTNVWAIFGCCRAAIPHLRRSSMSPAIVTVSSVNAFTALGSEAYSSAKAGLTSLTGNLAASLAHDGIRVNAVAPGTIRTRVWDEQDGGADRLRPLYPLGRVGEPEDVAAAVAFLASHDAAWITGHTLPVEGGLLTGDGTRMDVR